MGACCFKADISTEAGPAVRQPAESRRAGGQASRGNPPGEYSQLVDMQPAPLQDSATGTGGWIAQS